MIVSIFFALNRQTDYWEGKRNNLKHTTGLNALFLPDTSRHILFKTLAIGMERIHETQYINKYNN